VNRSCKTSSKLSKNRIARRASDLPVKAHVHFVQHGVVVQILAGGGEQPSHLDEILERSILDRVGNGLRLERHARANEIEQQLLRDRARVIRAREDQHLFARLT
jgi:hypothetical protein